MLRVVTSLSLLSLQILQSSSFVPVLRQRVSTELAMARRTFDGFMFDIDGTLANTDPAHFAVFKELLLTEPSINGGKEIDEDFFRVHIAGRQNQLIIADLFPDWDAARGKAWSDLKEVRWREYAGATMSENKMAGLDRLRTFIETQSAGSAHKACAVTNAPRLNAEVILQGIGYRDWFGERLTRPFALFDWSGKARCRPQEMCCVRRLAIWCHGGQGGGLLCGWFVEWPKPGRFRSRGL